MDIKIVEMAMSHLDDIMVIEHLCFTVPWSKNAFTEELQNNKFAIYFTAEFENHAYGYAGMWNVAGEGHITNIAVHPEFQRNHLGSQLLEKLIETAESIGIEALTLEVRKSNQRAISLYTKYGFVVEGLRKNYYVDNGEDALIMWKRLI